MNVIAIITARSGSKSIPHKNIRKLGGIPLLGWVVKAATKSKMIQKIILSTDSDNYFEIARSFNNSIIFHKRTPDLAEDVPSELVLLAVIEKFNYLFNNDSIIVLIQPTTPFITANDIDSCIGKLTQNPKMNSCISVKEVTDHAEWIISKKDGTDNIGISGKLSGDVSVRQNLRKRWISNGGAYVVRKSFLEKTKKVIDEDGTLVHEMSKIRSMDINEEDDFVICEALVNVGIIQVENNL